MNAKDVHQILERAGIPHALIGAAAVTLRGHSRSTLDTDFLTTDLSAFRPSLWKELVDRFLGLRGLKRTDSHDAFDHFGATSPYQ